MPLMRILIMATLLTNSFTQYELSAEEQIQGSIYTITQKQVLQNELAIAAETKLALVYDTSNPMDYVQQEAHFTGKVELLRFLLDMSDTSTEQAREAAALIEKEE